MLKNFLKYIFIIGCLTTISLSITAQKLRTIIIDAGHGYKGSNKTAPDGAPGVLCNEDDVALGVALKLGRIMFEKFPELNIVQTRKDNDFIMLPERSSIANENNGDLFISVHVNDTYTRWERVVDSFRIEIKFKQGLDTLGNKIQIPYEVQVPVYKRQRVGCNAFGAQIYVMTPKNNITKVNAAVSRQARVGDTTISADADILKSQASLDAAKFFKRSTILSKLLTQEFYALGRLFNNSTEKQGYQRNVGIQVLEKTSMPSVLIETGFICNDKDEAYLCSEAGQQELAETILKAFAKYKEKVERTTLVGSTTSELTTTN